MSFYSFIGKFVMLTAVVALGAACESSDTQHTAAQASDESSESMSDQPAASQDEPAQPAGEDSPAAKEANEHVQGDALVGRTSRETIEEQRDDWKQAVAQASPDEDAARALAEVEPGAKLTIYFGIWCSDCQRELPRFFKATDIAGELPFRYELIGVDKYFRAGEVSEQPLDLAAIPAFVVERDGEEVGRVVEASPSGIETDLLSLLRAEKSGVISATK